MGIKALLKEIKTRYPGVCVDNVHLGAFRGLRLACDIAGYAYKYMAVSNKEALKYIDIVKFDPDPAVLRSYWVERYYDFVMLFIESGITLIPVFDGKHFRLKDDTKAERQKKKEDREKRIIQLREQIQLQNNPYLIEELRSCLEARISFSVEDWDVLKQLFTHMGIPWMQAEYEAEALCARLVRCGVAAAAVSQDGDTLAHLAKIMIMDVRKDYRQGIPNHKCACIVLQDLLGVLHLPPKPFVDFCILNGTDYNDRVKNFGFVKCLSLMWKHGSVEKVLQNMKSDHVANNRMSNPELLREIRGYFIDDMPLNLVCKPNVLFEFGLKLELAEAQLEMSQSEKDQLKENAVTTPPPLKTFLMDVLLGFNQTRVMSTVDETIKILTEFNQVFAEMQKFVPLLE